MIRQKRMIHFFNKGMVIQVFDHFFRIFGMTFQTKGERFCSLKQKKCSKRRDCRAHITQDHRPDICHKRRARSRLRKHNSMIAVIWVCNSRILSRSFPVKSSRINDNASKCCSVPADKLCGRMYDNIRSMFDRPNPIRRSKRIIHHKRDLIFVS